MNVHFGNVPNGIDSKDLWDLFWEDSKEFDWDSPPLIMVVNQETGSAIMFDEVEELEGMAEIVKSAKRYMSDVTAVLVYSEGWGVMSDDTREESYKRIGPPSQHPDRVEMKVCMFMSKDFSSSRVLFHGKDGEPDKEDEMDGESLYNPATNLGVAAIRLRKEMDW